MISLAVFDMAGTTVNDGGAVYRALEQAVEETGVSVAPEDLQTWMGTEKRAAIAALITLGGGNSAGQIEPVYERFQQILRERYAAVPPTPIDGVPEAIAELRARGIKVALTTGFSRDIAELICDGLGWAVRADGTGPIETLGDDVTLVLDALVCGDEVLAGRPAPYMIHRAMEATGTADVTAVIVAGDTVVDAQAGVRSGATLTFGVLTGELEASDFAVQPEAVVIESVAAIPAVLEARA